MCNKEERSVYLWEILLIFVMIKYQKRVTMLEKEQNTFEQKLPELLKSNLGKFVLIKGDQVIGTYVAIDDALNIGYDKFKSEPFFVRQILAIQQPLNFTNNYMFA
jgi:hypothetical protein